MSPFTQGANHLDAIHVWKTEVEQHRIGPLGCHGRDSFFAGAGLKHRVPLLRQHRAQHAADRRLIVYHEHPWLASTHLHPFHFGHGLGQRQSDSYHRPPANAVIRLDPPAVGLNDALAYREPQAGLDDFRRTVIGATEAGNRIVALFGHQLHPGAPVRLYAVLADDAAHALSIVCAEAGASYPALTPDCPQAHLFEREVWEQLGVTPQGHPWLKAVRAQHEQGAYPFFAMEGQEAHEVAVGPVHAGVIEPGHFRFQCQGETVHHLEIHLGYQHRGIEEALAGGPGRRTMSQMETVAGDTSIGHGTAYCQVMEALGGAVAPPRAQALRAIALELERIANHTGDLGALVNDVGYLPAASYCGRLRGDALNMSAVVCGSRLGRGMVRPGGVLFDINDTMAASLVERLGSFAASFKSAVDLFFNTRSVVERLQGTGVVSEQACRDLGIVGGAARASGITRDVRADHPTGWYRQGRLPVTTWPSGDVFARAMVRRLEVERSLAFTKDLLQRLPMGPIAAPCGAPAPDHIAIAITEGWRGEVAHVAVTGPDGRFTRYKIVDPSFHNWTALAMALRGGPISDFPLNNKSFNLSYCGFDL
jgi:Ni,Fe-hydrogenase III large subunit